MLSYEQRPTVLAKQAALTAATERREELRVALFETPVDSPMGIKELTERDALEVEFDAVCATEAGARDALHEALQAAIAELFPEVVAAQSAAEKAEAEHAAVKLELDDAVRCKDPEETIAEFRKALDAKEIDIHRARRDVRKLVQKHGLG